ncbi:MAG: ABC transporter substrate-binding protein [Chloroflexi bacterium]|nr:ABC transporter substrate-binding protein [Chloroflexota bacterium]
MIKNSVFKKISLMILLIMMVGCVPMSEAVVDKKAASVAEKTIVRKEREKEKLAEERNKKKAKDYKLADEQILHLSGRDFYSFDPNNGYASSFNLMNLIFPGLTRYDTESGDFLSGIAESWEYSEDMQTWTFNLYDDIAWVAYDDETKAVEQVLGEDGEPVYVTSFDVKARILKILSSYYYSSNSYILRPIVGSEEFYDYGDEGDLEIETPSDTELIIHLNEPDSGWLAFTELTAFSAYPAWFGEEVNDGTYFYGPYVPTTSFEIAEETYSISLVKNPFWMGTGGLSEPYLDEIVFDLSDDTDVLEAFKDNQLDAVQLTYDEYQLAIEDPELSDYLVDADSNFGYYLFFFNSDLEPLDELEVRAAIAKMVDRDELLSALPELEGISNTGIIPDFMRAEPFSGGLSGSVDSNLVDEYGLPTFDFTCFEGDTCRSIYEVLNAQIVDQSGWYFELWEKTYASLFDDMEEGAMFNPGLLLMAYSLDSNDQMSLWDNLIDSIAFIDQQNKRWVNKEFEALYEQAKAEPDKEKRAELFSQMEEILVNGDVMVIPLFWGQEHWLVRFDVGADIQPLYQQLENWARIIP